MIKIIRPAVRKRFRNMRLKTKMAWIYTSTCFLPVCVIIFVTVFTVRTILFNMGTDNMESYLNQATTSMDNEIEIYNNLIKYISFNQTLSQVLSYDYESLYEMYNQLVTILDPTLNSLTYFHEEIESVTIYFESDIVKHGKTLAPISEIENEPWFDEVMNDNKTHWYINGAENTVFSANKISMLERNNLKGVLYISIDYDSVFKAYDNISVQDSGIMVTDENGSLIYSNSSFEDTKKYELSYVELYKMNLTGSRDYTIRSCESLPTGWTIWIYKPNSTMVSSVTPIITILIVAGIVCVTAVFFAIYITSKYVTSRIIRLQANMKQVEKGELTVTIQSDAEDEIGDLIKGFDDMIRKLNVLIKEVYESRINEKEYEMKALQAQINPHFLYNTLSLINWKAIDAGADDISKITLALSKFYRTSLNKGKNVMAIADEIDNMNAYIRIQQMMHDDGFDVVINIDKNILGYKTLNLILQPLIENAIDHGIDLKEDGRGVITVTGYEDGCEIVLEVNDNGVGMSREQADRILTEESKGYGVRNVNERIRLYYGNQYELKIESEIGIGTTVIVRFPKIQ